MTAFAQPTATTLSPTNLGSTNPTMNGSVNPNGAATTAYFEYGATTNYGSNSATFNLAMGNTNQSLSANIPGVGPGLTYHYRIIAANSAGTNFGLDVSLQTHSFTNINAGLPGVSSALAAWGDYDNNGSLDIVLSGQSSGSPGYTAGFWRNNSGTFVREQSPIGSLYEYVFSGQVAWGDMDNDGTLDFAITGTTPQSGTGRVFYNNGGSFQDTSTINRIVVNSSVAWGDYDNDGKPDLLLAGSGVCELYHNVNGYSLQKINAGLPGLTGASVAWADYDNDGFVDVLLSGTTTINQVWHNNGNETFSNINAGLPSFPASVAWGDYDNDGFLDIALVDRGSLSSTVEIWRNSGNGTFTKLANSGLSTSSLGKLAWGDYDNDGWLDLLVTSSEGVRLWRNRGDGTFAQVNSGLPTAVLGTVSWGDYDNDGRLDILLTGNNNPNGPISQIWRNLNPQTNTPPTAPSGLSVAQTGSEVTLQWNAATDAQTPSLGLTYNIRVGTTPDGFDIVSPSAAPDGRRLLPEMGNAHAGLTAIVKKLEIGTTYYWTVQAIDGAFAGSSFAAEQSFTYIPPPLAITLGASSVSATTATLNGSANPNSVSSSAYFELGLTTNYGTVFPSVSVGNGLNNVGVDRAATNLTPATVYHYRLVVTTDSANSFGADQTFRTVSAPAVTTLASSGLIVNANGSLDAGLNGTVNPNGVSTLVWFQYGMTTNYGNVTPSTNVGGGAIVLSFNNVVSGLVPGTEYHYRAVAQNSLGLVNGVDQYIVSANTVPSLSGFSDQSTAVNTPVAGIPFTVGDAQTAASNLVVTATSENSTLIPSANITFSGTGSSRTATLMPALNQIGRTTITIGVSDGVSVTTRGFGLSVGLPPGDANGDGVINDNELNGALAAYFANSGLLMTNATKLNDGFFEFGLTNLAGWNLNVEVSSDLVIWTNLPTSALPVYQFLDAAATNAPNRYYRLRPQQ